MNRAWWLQDVRRSFGVFSHRLSKGWRPRTLGSGARRPRFEPLEDRRLLAILTVNSALDNGTAGDGLVTLREAIIAANTDATTDLGQTGSGADTIQFDPLAFATPKTIPLVFGELLITESLTISGPGEAVLTIDARQNTRILEIASNTVDATISGVTLINGRATGDGGAIRSLASGVFTLRDSTITGSTATAKGGAIYSKNALMLTGSEIRDNSTTGGNGGGIYARSLLTLTNTTISDSSAVGSGGGIYSRSTLNVSDSTVSGNRSTGSNAKRYRQLLWMKVFVRRRLLGL